MAARKAAGGSSPSAASRVKSVADEIRERTAKLTKDPMLVDNPLDVHKVSVSPSGFYSLDDALGVGGYAKGRIHVSAGQPDAGKTALIAAGIGAYQRAEPDSVHAFLSTEPHGGDRNFLRTCGVNTDPDHFILLRPDSAEEAFFVSMVLMGFKEKDKQWVPDEGKKPVASVSWDSWGGSATTTLGGAALARVGEGWKLIASKAYRTGTTFFVTNHLHERYMNAFGDPRIETGGLNFLFMRTTTMWISPKNVIKDANNRRIAHTLRVSIQRNKVASPYRVAEMHLNYLAGFDRIIDALTFLEGRGVMFTENESATTYEFNFQYAQEEGGEKEQIKVRGRDAFIEAIRDNPYAAEAFLGIAEEVYRNGIDSGR